MSKRLVERALQAELSHHLHQEQQVIEEVESPQDWTTHNSRNSYSAKTVQGDWGQIPIQVPRDRQRVVGKSGETVEIVAMQKKPQNSLVHPL